ncbi:hypothetical protein ACRALDRAFT_208328 [Sodiomyces alcalophilus JCM 7366]|uniref:uncharacterized protein n=1 Tax=Sodiomyces alcalophilus JCM 7366 TaxID=591952 RepID=UPI0039B6CBD9
MVTISLCRLLPVPEAVVGRAAAVAEARLHGRVLFLERRSRVPSPGTFLKATAGKTWRVGSVDPVIPAPSSRASSITPETSKSATASTASSPPVDSAVPSILPQSSRASSAAPAVKKSPVGSSPPVDSTIPAVPSVLP